MCYLIQYVWKKKSDTLIIQLHEAALLDQLDFYSSVLLPPLAE